MSFNQHFRDPALIPQKVVDKMNPADRAALGRNCKTTAERADQQAVKSERELQRQIANWLRLRGVPTANPRMDRKTTLALGHPDFTFPWLPYAGRFVALECKSVVGKQTPEQIKCEAEIRANGGLYFVVRSLAEVVEALSK